MEIAEPNWARRLVAPQPPAGAANRSRATAATAATAAAVPAATSGTVLPDDLYATLGPLWHLYQVSAPLAWASARGSRAVKVCIIDTGILRGHEEFSDGRVVGGWNRWGWGWVARAVTWAPQESGARGLRLASEGRPGAHHLRTSRLKPACKPASPARPGPSCLPHVTVPPDL